jgi:sugar lactone lactonase YvrE
MIVELSGEPADHPALEFTPGTGCANDRIRTISGDFKADGIKVGDMITVVYCSFPENNGIYGVTQVVGNILEIPQGSLGSGGLGAAVIARVKGGHFLFEGMEFYRGVWSNYSCGEGDFLVLSCGSPGGDRPTTETIKLNTFKDFYIADTSNHRIRKVDTAQNMITTIAGNSDPSSLNQPFGVWVDSSRNIYIADTGRDVVRRMDHLTGAVSIVAGIGSAGYSGDDVPATTSKLNSPYSVSTDGYDNIYIADTSNSRIRKVDAASGTITTVAGDGSSGYVEDGVFATTTRINQPQGVFTDYDGNIYIADTNNNRIRRVDAGTGIITTVAGDGGGGYWGDATPPTEAQIQPAQSVRVDADGNLFIADSDNNRIRRVDAEVDSETGFPLIYTVAGNGAAEYSGDGGSALEAGIRNPHDLWVVASGDIYIADTDNNCIRKVDAGTGIITTVAGGGSPPDGLGDGGLATQAKLNKPRGLFVDPDGNIYIADDGHHRIRKVDAGTEIITTVAGNGDGGYLGDGVAATSTRLNHPYGIYLDPAGDIFIADKDNKRVRKVDAVSGIITTVAGNGSGTYLGDGLPATSNGLNKPCRVYVDVYDNLFITDTDNNCVRKVDASGTMTTVAGNGDEGYLEDGVPATTTRLDHPRGVDVDAYGNLFIADTDNKRIRRVDEGTGIITTVVGNGSGGYWGDAAPATQAKFNKPKGLYVDGDGNIYIADSDNDRIRKVHAHKGIITTVAGNGEDGYIEDGVPATSTELNDPMGVWVDVDGHLYIADTNNYRVRKVDAETGIITTVVGNGTAGYTGDGGPAAEAALKALGDVCVDDLGNVIVADTPNHVIREAYASSGLIATILGEVSGGYSGDGVPATSSKLNFPGDLCRDALGNLYIADTQNNRIRKINVETGLIETVAGNGLRDYLGDEGPATEGSLNQPMDVFVDASGNVFIADTENSVVRKVDNETGIITAFAGNGERGYAGDGGPAASAKLKHPRGVFVTASGDVFIADSENNIIRKVDADTEIIDTIAGIPGSAGYEGDGDPAILAKLRKPRDVWVDGFGNIFVADTENHRIRKIDLDGIITTVAGNGSAGYSGEGGPATEASFKKPGGVSVDGDGNIYIADTENQCIRKVFADTGIVKRVAGDDGDEGYSGDGGKPKDAKLNFPQGVWADQGASGGGGIVRP